MIIRLNPRLIAEIELERERQAAKWGCVHAWGEGDCSSANINVPKSVKAMVLSEKCGEVSRAVLETNDDHLRSELVHVAAVACAWLASWGDYREGKQ